MTSDGPLDRKLRDEPYRFDYFQAVRLLERLFPDRRRVGFDHALTDEIVRFRALPSLEFPASQIYDIRDPKDAEGPPEMVVTFFGMQGINGALPHHYTEWIIERARRKDHTFREFLDLFNHRLLSLFYRAWGKYNFWLSTERALLQERREVSASPERARAFLLERRPEVDRFSQILLDLSGFGAPAIRYRARERDRLVPRNTIDDETLRFYCALLAQRHRSAVGLEAMLEDYFGWQVRVHQFSGQWLALESDDLSQMVPGGNTQLGVSLVAGKRIWDVQGKFRLRVGPVNYEQFCRMLPVGDAYQSFVDLVRTYAGPQFDFDIELLLNREEVPRFSLAKGEGIGTRLGWNTWGRREHVAPEDGRVTLSVRDM